MTNASGAVDGLPGGLHLNTLSLSQWRLSIWALGTHKRRHQKEVNRNGTEGEEIRTWAVVTGTVVDTGRTNLHWWLVHQSI